MKSAGRLEKVLTAGQFAVTAELGPPQNANPEAIKKKSKHCAGNVDGANITDNQTAIVRMSSIAAGAIALSCGVEGGSPASLRRLTHPGTNCARMIDRSASPISRCGPLKMMRSRTSPVTGDRLTCTPSEFM